MSIAVVARTLDEVSQTVRMIEANGGQACAIVADVCNAADVAEMVRAVERKLGAIELLINAAGTTGPIGPTWEVNAEEWWACLDVNLRGTFHCCHAVLAGMVSRGKGRIINVASGAGKIPIPYMSAYAISKAAVIRLTETLASELRPHGISVFSIQPGTVRTAMTEKIIGSEEGRRWMPWCEKLFELGQDITAEPSVKLVVALSTGAADPLTGRLLDIGEDLTEMVRQVREIQRLDWYTLRIQEPEGTRRALMKFLHSALRGARSLNRRFRHET
jgi:NAD(P)-dependent dehydrogenase (short-subunit alcohol dehydrogenase family)